MPLPVRPAENVTTSQVHQASRNRWFAASRRTILSSARCDRRPSGRRCQNPRLSQHKRHHSRPSGHRLSTLEANLTRRVIQMRVPIFQLRPTIISIRESSVNAHFTPAINCPSRKTVTSMQISKDLIRWEIVDNAAPLGDFNCG